MPKPATSQKTKRFVLNVVGAIEDRPRVLRAYGRACGGEFALVMRPREHKAVLVHLTKQGGRVWRSGEAGDSPLLPPDSIDPKEAVALVKSFQKDAPDPGPMTLRGRWAGHLYCDDQRPILRLSRRLAAYGTLEVRSDLGKGWSWAFRRDTRWFATEGTDSGDGFAFLDEAVEAGILGAMRLVREACSFRDTRRRAAVDTAYGAEHPIAQPAPRPDPVERLKEPPPPKPRKPRKPRAKKAPIVPPSLKDSHAPPAEPGGIPDLAKAAEAARREADALAAAAGLPWTGKEDVHPLAIAEWFEDGGFYDAGSAVRAFLDDPVKPAAEIIAEVEKIVRKAAGDADERETALGQVARLKASLESTPVLLARTRSLVRYANAMVRSPACLGPEQAEAADAIGRAIQVYETAREGLLQGKDKAARRQVRTAAERVALSAAKVARSCARGQQSLTARAGKDATSAAPTAAPTEPKKKRGRKPRATPAEPAAPGASGEVDPAKDKILLDAFSAAIAQAMGGGAA